MIMILIWFKGPRSSLSQFPFSYQRPVIFPDSFFNCIKSANGSLAELRNFFKCLILFILSFLMLLKIILFMYYMFKTVINRISCGSNQKICYILSQESIYFIVSAIRTSIHIRFVLFRP